MISIDDAKKSTTNYVKYRLKNATVWTGEHGYTFSLFMDKLSDDTKPKADEIEYKKLKIYLEEQLQSNKQRFAKQALLI